MASLKIQIPTSLHRQIQSLAPSEDMLNQVFLEAINLWLTMHRQKEPDAWDALNELTGTVEGPEDWSVAHDHYLYGTPKRSMGKSL